MKQPFTRALVTAAAALFAAACAQSNGDINRVQPNVVKKADLLDGEWFFRTTVTYAPFNTGFTFTGQTGNMEKLVWELQESHLVGYRSYPYSPGTEANVDPNSKISGTTAKYCDAQGVCKGGQKYFGTPVVAFPIKGHFDIQRGYNPATGEQTNVISENMTDRPWNQREFVRVDWAANMLNVSQFGPMQNLGYGTSTANWIQPNETGEDPYDWPTFEYTKNADGKDMLTYFDVTGRYMANPDQYFFEGYGYVPMCWLSSGGANLRGMYDCSSSEIKMRISVSKVDQQWSRDYEPMVYPNELMSLFGYFRTERLNYDKKYGYTDSAVIRLANRHRNWEHYFETGADGMPDVTRPIAAAQRKPKPVVYYVTPANRLGGQERYDELWEPAQRMDAEYARAFGRAHAAAMGKDPSDPSLPRAFHLCNNPVKAGDPAACGAAGLSPKLGDLRYSFVNTVAEPTANGLLGYGPSCADPETGQMMAGMSNMYLAPMDEYGRGILNWILLLEGEKPLNEYISGQTVRDYLASRPAYNIKGVKEANGLVQAELQSVPTRDEETKGAFDRPTTRVASIVSQLKTQGGLPKATRDELRAAAQQLEAHPELEAAILDNPEFQADLANLLPVFAQDKAKSDPQFLRKASRTMLTNLQASEEYTRARLSWASRNNVYLSEFFDHTLVATAKDMIRFRKDRIAQLKLPGARCALDTECGRGATCAGVPEADRPALGDKVCKQTRCADLRCTADEAKAVADDDIARKIRQEVWLSIALHETGHTLNLRHNFQGTYDAVNYPDHYWDARKTTITVDQGGVKKLPRTPADLRNALEGTEAQRVDHMFDQQYSSIMDYNGKLHGDWVGLGKYDEAAILFAYSGTGEPELAYAGAPVGTGAANPGYVEVFNSARRDSKAFPGSDGANMTISGAGVDLPMVNATHLNPNVRNYTERFHYSTVPLHFGEGTDITAVIDDGIRKLKSRKLMRYAEVKKDEQKVADALRADPTLINDPDRAMGVLGTPVLRVPYMFCSDDSVAPYGGVGPVMSCNWWDNGADYYEMVRTKLESYWAYYFDSHFRRDQASFSGDRATGNAYSTFMFTADNYKHWVLELYKNADQSQEQRLRFKLDPILQDTWTMSVLDGVNAHLNVMSVPPFGLFMYRNLRSGPRWDVISEGDDFDTLNDTGKTKLEDYYASYYGAEDFVELPRGQGRRMYSRYDFKSGFGFWNRMMEAGHYNDQYGAMFAAVIPGVELQGVDTTADENRYNIGYYLMFRKEMTDTFGALWGQNEEKVRPMMYKTLNPAGQVTTTPAIAWRVYINGGELFQGFNYPKPAMTTCSGTQTPPSCYSTDQRAAPANIQLTWTSRIYSLYLGLAAFRSNYDMDYAKTNQVYKLGGNEDFTVAAGFHTVEVADIVTGGRYVAVEQDGAAVDTTAAIRTVNIAKIHLSMVNDPAQCPIPDYLLVQGYTCMAAAEANNPALVEERRRYWMEIYQDSMRDLDLMRGFYAVFGRAF